MESNRCVDRWVRRLCGLVLIAATSVLALPGLAAAQTVSTTLLWTAPGDDGMVGRASSYALRYRTTAIVGTDTLSWWNAATAVSGLPAPGVSGATDSVVVSGLDATKTYYFVLRTADEVPNWSGYSNVAIKAASVDATPPAAITDLAVPAAGASAPAQPAQKKPAGSPPR
jgi:hypothetical protein